MPLGTHHKSEYMKVAANRVARVDTRGSGAASGQVPVASRRWGSWPRQLEPEKQGKVCNFCRARHRGRLSLFAEFRALLDTQQNVRSPCFVAPSAPVSRPAPPSSIRHARGTAFKPLGIQAEGHHPIRNDPPCLALGFIARVRFPDAPAFRFPGPYSPQADFRSS